MTPTTDQMSTIFRQVEADLGATGLADFAIENLEASLDTFKPKNVNDLFEQFRKLFMEVKSTQPRISLIIYYFYDLWEELQKEKEAIKTVEDFKEVIVRTTRKIQVENDDDFQNIVRNGVQLIENGDRILVHSHSGTVRRILSTAHYEGKKFDVILAEQEAEKTLDMIEYFKEKGIDFVVVPEYMLSHILDDVTKVFFGATTLNYEQNFVCDAGTYSVLAEFHAAQIPTYMFISTKKFSLWKTTQKHLTHKTAQRRVHAKSAKAIDYDRIKFSHDRVPAKLFNSIVTESGTYIPEEIKTIYKERYDEREAMRKKYFANEEEAAD